MLLNVAVNANVIGINIGSDNFKVAIVQPGDPLEIVTNFQSKRKTPTCVTFYKGERSFGADSYALMARKPELTFTRLLRTLGRTPEHPHVSKQFKSHYFPYEIYSNETWGGTSFKQEETYYTPEELIAMLLQHAKDMTKNYGGKAIRDCVITVPSSFTQRERSAMYTAADIADVKVLTLIEENTAAALHFGIDRVFDEPHNVLFFNMGSSEVQVSIVTYSSYPVKEGGKNKTIGQFEVVGKGWDSDLGCFNFDVRLAELLANRFNEVWGKKASGKGKDLKDFVRPMTRLRMEAVKIREVLSANNEVPVKAEQLHAEVDLITKVTRADLEAACDDLINRILLPIQTALTDANLTLADIKAVELLGGGVRMPKVKKVLEEYFKPANLELGQHLNGDEAMALGSAFRAANLSTAFRVRKVGISDILSFGVSVHLETLPKDDTGFFKSIFSRLTGGADKKKDTTAEGDAAWQKSASLYPKRSVVPSKTKTVAFQYDKDILCKLEYDDDVTLPAGTDKTIAVYNITGVADFAKDAAAKGLALPKVHLSFALDSSGMVTLFKAEATVDVPQEEPTEAEKEAEAKDEAAANATEVDAAGNETDTNSTASNETATKKKKTDKKEKKKEKSKKETVLRRTLPFEENHVLVSPSTWSPAMISAARNRLKILNAADEARKAKEQAMNDLESYMYKVKNRVTDDEKDLAKVSSEEQRQAVLELCSQTDEWLYEEGAKGDIATFKTKQSQISKLAEPIFLRFSELTARPAAVEKARKAITEVRIKVAEWDTKMPHISEEEKSKLLDTVAKVESWLDEKEEKQKSLPDTVEAAFMAEDVPAQLKTLGLQFEKLLKKPKPAPVKPAPSNTTSATNETNSTVTGDNTTEPIKVEVKTPGEDGEAANKTEAEETSKSAADEESSKPASEEL